MNEQLERQVEHLQESLDDIRRYCKRHKWSIWCAKEVEGLAQDAICQLDFTVPRMKEPLREKSISELREELRVNLLLASKAADNASFRIYQERADNVSDELVRRLLDREKTMTERQQVTRPEKGSS